MVRVVTKPWGFDMPGIVRVQDKLKAFREDFPATEYGLIQSFTEDDVGGVARVIGWCSVVDMSTGQTIAQAQGTRALRPPVPGAQGAKDTRDPDRAMTQALGRVLGLMGYADAHGIEGDTDEPDTSGVTATAKPKQAKAPPPPPPPPANPVAEARRHLAGEIVDDDTLDLDLVDTLEIREMLNARPPGDRGKVRAVLVQHGFDLPLPEQMKAGRYQKLTNVVTAELADIDEATT
jgi:hypothetical protein